MSKTNAMRVLDKQKIPYQSLSYNNEDGKIHGTAVAEKIGKPADQVFKTLVASGAPGHIYVFVIPVADELDVKKAAKAAGEKKLRCCLSRICKNGQAIFAEAVHRLE